MVKRAYSLPGLTQLAAFEAAARHGSFKSAAQELDVTASAISHQIRALEDNLSTQLFMRRHRSIELSEAGRELFQQLEISFQAIGTTCENIREKGAQTTVRIGASMEFSSLWLDPRVPSFLKNNRDYRVSTSVINGTSDEMDELQLRICYGRPDNESGVVRELFQDRLVPVANAEFAERYRVNSLSALARLPLIKVEAQGDGWVSWSEWFKQLGYLGDINYAQKNTNYLEALNVAKNGFGAVLGWRQLLKPMLDRGELVLLTNFSMPAPEPFYLQSVSEKDLNVASEALRDWMLYSEEVNMRFS